MEVYILGGGGGGAGIVFGILCYSAVHSQFNVVGAKSLQFFRLVSPSFSSTVDIPDIILEFMVFSFAL